MKPYDAVIVGGGPIGGYVAINISKQGYDVALFEEHKTIGTPLKCAGLVTPRVFDFFKFNRSKTIQNNIYGAHIHAPSGEKLTIGGDKQHAIVIDRPLFDQEILREAEQAGAEIHLETKVTKAKRTKNMVLLDTQQKQLQQQITKLLIGADGPYSKIRDAFNFPEPQEYLKGIGAKVTNICLDPRYVELFIGSNIAPGFFAWAIPTNKDGTEARIGLCIDKTSDKTIKQCFVSLLKHKRLKNVNIEKQIGGTIPLGPLKKTYESNVLLVGDAAAQVKPTSGGGVYPGLVCAKHCADVACEALQTNALSSQTLKKYQKLWTNDIGGELARGMTFRKIYTSLNDENLNKYLQKLNTDKNIDIIDTYGDIDYPSKLALPLIRKNPSLVRLLPSILRRKQ